MTPVRRRVRGLLAALALAGILIGLPVTLLAVGGNPIPSQIPSWEELRAGLLSPDDGSVALAAITIIGWVAWLVLAGAITAEVVTQLRGVAAPRLPGMRLPQLAARNLVSTAALLFMTAPLLIHHQLPADAQPPTSHAAQLIPSTPTAKPTAVPPVAGPRPPAAAPGLATVPYTMRRGDTLWSIAQHYLGSGARYPAIVALNTDVLGGDPDFIAPGTVLRLPDTADRDQKPRRAHRVTVDRGDTLSGIAAEELGDPDRYPEIFRASAMISQPGGQRLTDPDVIDIGWTLNIPGAATQPRTARQQADRDEEATRPTMPRRDPDGQPTPKPTPISQPTSPTSTSPGTAQSAQPGSQDINGTEDGDRMEPVWLLTGLTGGGMVLAGSMWLALRQRRRAQYRNRRPGRTIKVPAPVLVPVEQTVTAIGDGSAPTVELLDAVLRRLAAARSAGKQRMPRLAAVELGAETITLHLSEPDDLAALWQASDDRLQWTVRAGVDLDQVGPEVGDQPAPYPLLVTIGSTDTGNPWLLNCENAPIVSIIGDPTYSQDLARYLVAELACNPWSAGVRVDCVGVADEIPAMNPDRIRSHKPAATDTVAEVLADAVAMVDRTEHAGTDAVTARAHQAGADPWPARLLLIDVVGYSTAVLGQLREVLNAAPHRTAASVVLTGEAQDRGADRGLVVQVTADGRVRLPHAGLDLVAVGLTSDEALGCAALLAAADDTDDTAMPEQADADGWRTFANEAGAIRPGHTQPRTPPESDQECPDEDSKETSSILGGEDADYLEVAATTAEDLALLAPRVPVDIRSAVADADPTLDDDVTTWFSDRCDRPRLTLLGPVGVRAHGSPISKRKPYYTELLTYLATRPHGATPEEVAESFSITGPRVRNDVKVVRDWLGVNPRTGRKHLPDARDTAAAQDRGIGVYQIEDLLIDADLFRRLRVRGETRGPHGITDLRRALSLVTGQPLDQLRPGGWTWMFEGDRLDQHLLCAVVDVAHLVVTHALHQSDQPVARAAAELAALAAPYEEIPRLDLAAVAAAQGQHDEADRIVRDDVCNRTDDNLPPVELSERTATILRARDWPRQRKAAS